MIIFSFRLPPKSVRGPVVLVMILEAVNLQRMAEADPYDVRLRDLPGMEGVPASDIDLVIAKEDDLTPLAEFQKNDDIAGLVTWLERGRQIMPGDFGPPVKLDLSKERRQ